MQDRYSDEYPKIGIRPTIDGRRRGVRESLEDQTMGLAKLVQRFLSANVRYNNGKPVKCVIADTTIGGVAESAACAEKFRREGVGISITVTPCWCYGTETMDMDPTMPKAIWGFNGTERPGAVYLAAVLAAHSQKGIPAFGIYGQDVQDKGTQTLPDDVAEKLLRFTRAAVAAATMKGKSYLSMGYCSMGIAGSQVQEDFFQHYLGMRNEYVESVEFLRRMNEGIYDVREFDRALAWVKENCKEAADNNDPAVQQSREKKDANWEFIVKMAMIGRDLMIGNPRLAEMGYEEEAQGHNAIAAGFQGQRQWTDHYPNGDFMESILCSSFDWNGIRAPFVLATENDSLNGTAMLFGHLLTNTASAFADVRTYWSPQAIERVTGWKPEGRAANGFIHLINSGAAAIDACGRQKQGGESAMKPFWDITEEEMGECLEAVDWCPANVGYFRGGGYSSHFLSEGGMPITMVRVNLIKGLGPVLQLAEGWTVELPTNVNNMLEQRTDPTWPTTWFAPNLTGKGAFADVYSVMNNWGANHGAFNYGHIGAELITLASILRIPVCMHNVPEDKIFRPSSWAAFGMDPEGADYRACQNFGPLY